MMTDGDGVLRIGVTSTATIGREHMIPAIHAGRRGRVTAIVSSDEAAPIAVTPAELPATMRVVDRIDATADRR